MFCFHLVGLGAALLLILLSHFLHLLFRLLRRLILQAATFLTLLCLQLLLLLQMELRLRLLARVGLRRSGSNGTLNGADIKAEVALGLLVLLLHESTKLRKLG